MNVVMRKQILAPSMTKLQAFPSGRLIFLDLCLVFLWFPKLTASRESTALVYCTTPSYLATCGKVKTTMEVWELAIALFACFQAILPSLVIGILDSADCGKSYTTHEYCRNYRIAQYDHPI